MASLARLSHTSTPSNSKSVAFLTCIALFSFIMTTNSALLTNSTLSSLLNFQTMILNFWSWSRHLWSTHPVVRKIPMHHACRMESVQRGFPRHSRITPLFLMILTPQQDVVTLARHMRSGESRSIVNGLSPTVHISSTSNAATSMLNPLALSRLSSTSSNTSTRAMIVSLCSLAIAQMKSSSTWMPAISLSVRLPSTSLASKCMIAIQVSSTSKYIFPTNSMLHGLRTALEMFRTLFNKLDPKTLPSLPISKPTSNFHLPEKPSTMIFLQSSFVISCFGPLALRWFQVNCFILLIN